MSTQRTTGRSLYRSSMPQVTQNWACQFSSKRQVHAGDVQSGNNTFALFTLFDFAAPTLQHALGGVHL